MARTIRTRWFRLGALLALVLAVAALAQPSLCGAASGDEPDTKDAENTVRRDGAKDQAGKDEPDFRIELDKLGGKDLDKAIDARFEEMRRRIEELERDMDKIMNRELGRSMDDLRDNMRRRLRDPNADGDAFTFPVPHDRIRIWRDGDLFDRPIPPEIEEMLKRIEEQWPEEFRQRREQDGDQGPDHSRPFEFRIDLGPGERSFSLRMDARETDEAYTYTLDMPGMEKDDIVVEVKDNVLSITGERKEQVEEQKDGQTVKREIVYGRFKRAVTLPRNADTNKITSKYDNGVLTITVPKRDQEADQSKRIIVHQP